MLTHLSLCTGIGGIDLAAKWAGFTTIAQCEIDEYASKVLAKNFKGVPNLHDIRTVTNAVLRENGIEPNDITVLSAGFPCQPYSLAGKGKGDGDERDLWERLQDVSERLNRDGSSVKIRPVCLPELIRNTSSEYLPTLPRWGTVCHGEYGALLTSERLISENGCLSAPIGTPTASMTIRSERFARKTLTPAEFGEKFPTPLASDAIRMRYSEESLRKVGIRRTNGEYKAAGCNLSEYVAVFPTPQATSWGCSGARKKLRELQAAGKITEQERKGMQAGNGGKLNPTWVEWLMAFPLGWTDLDV